MMGGRKQKRIRQKIVIKKRTLKKNNNNKKKEIPIPPSNKSNKSSPAQNNNKNKNKKNSPTKNTSKPPSAKNTNKKANESKVVKNTSPNNKNKNNKNNTTKKTNKKTIEKEKEKEEDEKESNKSKKSIPSSEKQVGRKSRNSMEEIKYDNSELTTSVIGLEKEENGSSNNEKRSLVNNPLGEDPTDLLRKEKVKPWFLSNGTMTFASGSAGSMGTVPSAPRTYHQEKKRL